MNPEDIKKILDSLPEKEPPQGFRERLMDRLQKEKQKEARRKDTIRLAAGLAAVLVLFITVRFMDSGTSPFADLARDRAKQELNDPLTTTSGGDDNGYIKGNDKAEGQPGIPEETGGYIAEAGEVRLYVKNKADAFDSLRRMAADRKLKIIETAGDTVTVAVTTREQDKILFDELEKLGRVDKAINGGEGVRYYRIYIVLE
ncbi:MAG TPA: hypothetical protein PK830_03640 [Candidatus Atribacteria bacterium]|nr:hypothetical protein [Candidatus Atribacteria bacterium]HPT78182.1 hypothetical protein [Candidatus Atribacteria bacterium]